MAKGPNPHVVARDWLDRLLAGFHPTATDLDSLVSICGADEGLYLEFKPGADPSSGTNLDPADVLRKYMAGFANSDGGFVIFGYYQKQGAFDGFSAPGGGDLVEWVTRALQPLAAYLAPPARIFSVSHPTTTGQTVDVLIVAVRRAPALVPIIHRGRPCFYFRIGDSTVPVPTYNTIGVPEYLVADVLLGRRQRPWLLPTAPTVTFDPQRGRKLGAQGYAHEATIAVTFENESLVFAEAVTAGIVSWSLDLQRLPTEPPAPRRPARPEDFFRPSPAVEAAAASFMRRPPGPVPRSLDAYVELAISSEPWREICQSVHAPAWRRGLLDLDLPPFASNDFTFGPLVLPVFESTAEPRKMPRENEADRRLWPEPRARVRLQMALYVVARAGEPQWFELEIVYGEESLPRTPQELKRPSPRASITLRRGTGERVRIGIGNA